MFIQLFANNASPTNTTMLRVVAAHQPGFCTDWPLEMLLHHQESKDKRLRRPPSSWTWSTNQSVLACISHGIWGVRRKTKGLVFDMIEKLESEAEADATMKAHCDKELAETKTKTYDQESKENEIEKTTSQLDVNYKTKEAASLAQLAFRMASEVRLAVVKETQGW